MTTSNIVELLLTILIFLFAFYWANKIIKGSANREKELKKSGTVVRATILSMRQSGVFLNNNPVLELKLKIEDEQADKSWLVEKHSETALLIALNSYEVGGVYNARMGKNQNDILLMKDESGKPIHIE
ncbi:hypothetical protein FJU30_03640 [Affinibrenneria salicis]|uniref:Uncharacterized protein n=1 Tax=Affinibrenneria salicis TaxID=2590031 RepID=A0A5J5G7Y8_9GAMM|nr:hypothetical protein [Affinibrenneria salicis]KAA9002629.1 hypothetical protein FJU30_01125 [Affinibrenneria salicis]KAA9003083.1 hypothetical protein FJU30_03640 [Affinibrenneria salicis]